MLYKSENLVIENSKNLRISYENFSFKKDCLTIIKGSSGIGKSTLLNVLGLLNRNFADGSRIELALPYQTVSLMNLNVHKSEKLREKYFSYILQEDHLVDAMNVLDNILFPSFFRKKSRRLLEDLENLLENEFLRPIEEKLSESSAILSGGEKKKVALLRAILKEPEILIADEPWTNLGKDDVEEYTNFFINQRKNKSTILATHDERVTEKYVERYPEFVEVFDMMEKESSKKNERKLRLIKRE